MITLPRKCFTEGDATKALSVKGKIVVWLNIEKANMLFLIWSIYCQACGKEMVAP